MRECVLRAALFDLDNPEKELVKYKPLLLTSNNEEKEDYISNAVYSHGSMMYNEDLIRIATKHILISSTSNLGFNKNISLVMCE